MLTNKFCCACITKNAGPWVEITDQISEDLKKKFCHKKGEIQLQLDIKYGMTNITGDPIAGYRKGVCVDSNGTWTGVEGTTEGDPICEWTGMMCKISTSVL